jgi:hypothetical protein
MQSIRLGLGLEMQDIGLGVGLGLEMQDIGLGLEGKM